MSLNEEIKFLQKWKVISVIELRSKKTVDRIPAGGLLRRIDWRRVLTAALFASHCRLAGRRSPVRFQPEGPAVWSCHDLTVTA